MSSKRNDLVEAAVAQLNTSRPGGIPESSRTRSIGIEATKDMKEITVVPRRDTAKAVHSKATPLIRRNLLLEVQCVAAADGPMPSGTTTRTADEAVDELTAWAETSLGGSNLGGKAIVVEYVDTTFRYEMKKKVSVCEATVIFSIDYVTVPNNPSSPV